MRTDVAVHQATTTEHAQSQKGSVLVEFALILPVFLTLLFGVVTFSIALYNKTVLTMATREGARAGAMYVATAAANITAANTAAATTATNTTKAVCQNILISFGSSITPSVTSWVDSNKMIIVDASISFTGLYISPSVMTISAYSAMRTEYQ